MLGRDSRGFIAAIVCSLLAFAVPAFAQTPGFDNTLEIATTQAAPGAEGVVVEIYGSNVEDVGGYTLVVAYDVAYIEAVDGNLEGTLADLVGAEFVNYENHPAEGYFAMGVLLDLVPPYDGQVIPAVPELELVFANFVCNVRPEAISIDQTELIFVNQVGTPPLSNMFVVGAQSVAPLQSSGFIEIVLDIPFVRGDANEDGGLDVADGVFILGILTMVYDVPECADVVDVNDDGTIEISDAIYLLNYMFQSGTEPPAPFPLPDFDPTPDALLCELAP